MNGSTFVRVAFQCGILALVLYIFHPQVLVIALLNNSDRILIIWDVKQKRCVQNDELKVLIARSSSEDDLMAITIITKEPKVK